MNTDTFFSLFACSRLLEACMTWASLCEIDFGEQLWNLSVISRLLLVFFPLLFLFFPPQNEIPSIAKPQVALCGASETFNLIFPRRRGLAMPNRIAAPKWISHFPEITRVTLTRSVSENAINPNEFLLRCSRPKGQPVNTEPRQQLRNGFFGLIKFKAGGFFFLPAFQRAREGIHPCRRQPTPDLICLLRLPSCWGNPTRVRQ